MKNLTDYFTNLLCVWIWHFCCQKLLFYPQAGLGTKNDAFLHQLTHNMTTDRSLNYKFNIHEKSKLRSWGEHVVYRNSFWHSEQFLYTTCSPYILQKEELLTKIYLCQVHLIPFWLVFAKFKCMVHVALPKWPIIQFKPVQPRFVLPLFLITYLALWLCYFLHECSVQRRVLAENSTLKFYLKVSTKEGLSSCI